MSAPSYNPTQQTTTTSGSFAANPAPPTAAATDSYATNPTATNPTTASAGTGSAYNPATGASTTSTTTTGKTTGSSVKGFGKAIKHGIAAVHGVGEEARGRINGAIDGAMHDVCVVHFL